VTVAENPTAGQGAVVLDIGDDVGALVVSMPAELVGAEVEICPLGRRDSTPDEGGVWWQGQWRGHGHAHHHHGPAWPHVAVIARSTPGGVGHAAVFPGLRADRYELWRRPDGPTALVVEIAGGEVSTAGWPQVG
jgi:hypothetical protein